VIRSLATAVGLFVFIACSAVPAQAQFIGQAIGGMTSAADQQLFLGGSIGKRGRMMEFDVEVGRMRDILPKGLFNAFNELQDSLVDSPVKAIARLTNTYVAGNVRFISPRGPVRPFVGGGAGLAHLAPKFEVTLQVGDFTFDLDDVFGSAFESENKLMTQVGGGLSFDITESATIDTGYRYLMINTDYSGFNITGVDIRAHVFYVAFGGRW
jgi:hypothetical protein